MPKSNILKFKRNYVHNKWPWKDIMNGLNFNLVLNTIKRGEKSKTKWYISIEPYLF